MARPIPGAAAATSSTTAAAASSANKASKGAKHEFRCGHCQRLFSTKGNLARHIQATHVGGRTFPCHLCGKEFKRKEDRKTHFRVHTGTVGRMYYYYYIYYKILLMYVCEILPSVRDDDIWGKSAGEFVVLAQHQFYV